MRIELKPFSNMQGLRNINLLDTLSQRNYVRGTKTLGGGVPPKEARSPAYTAVQGSSEPFQGSGRAGAPRGCGGEREARGLPMNLAV